MKGGYKDLLPLVEDRIEAQVGQGVALEGCKDAIDVVQRNMWQILAPALLIGQDQNVVFVLISTLPTFCER